MGCPLKKKKRKNMRLVSDFDVTYYYKDGKGQWAGCFLDWTKESMSAC